MIAVTLSYEKRLDEPVVKQNFAGVSVKNHDTATVDVELTSPENIAIWNDYRHKAGVSKRFTPQPVNYRNSILSPRASEIVFACELTPQQAWAEFLESVDSHKAAVAEMETRRDELQSAHEAAMERHRQEIERRLREDVTPEFSNGTAVINLQERLFFLARHWYDADFDDRFNNWAKEVTGVDESVSNGYMYAGHFVSGGTVEIDCRAKVYLIAATAGSRKNNTTHYSVILFDGTEFKRTDIQTTDEKAGWALRLRDDIQTLLTDTTGDPFAELREAVDTSDDVVSVSRELLEKALKKL